MWFGDLLVITPRFVGCLVAVALVGWVLVWAAWRRRRRVGARRAGLRTAGAALAALCLTLLAAGGAVNAHYQYLPRVDDVVGVPTWPQTSLGQARAAVGLGQRSRFPVGAVVSARLPGPVSGFGAHEALVYLPPQYFTDPGRRFPVVYLLHGSPGAPVDWFRAARAAQAGAAIAAAGNPTILVAPRVSRRWTDDSECVDRPSERIESYVVDDVVVGVDRQFRTIPDRAARGVAGMSAGGYCALNIGLRHRALFAVILDLSGYDHPTHAGG